MSPTSTTMATDPVLKTTPPLSAGADVLHLKTSNLTIEPSASASESRSPVDALLSPTADEPIHEPLPIDDAEADTHTQEILEDVRFSTVPLSATTPQDPLADGFPATQRSSVSSTTNMEVSLLTPRTSMSATLLSGPSSREDEKLGRAVDGNEKRNKRPSSLISPIPTSATSSTNPKADFILAKLDKDMMSPTKSTRTSLDGKYILQAEFEHAREENEKDDTESIDADGINWGVWRFLWQDMR
jgi:ecotropic viral integration site 5 protein